MPLNNTPGQILQIEVVLSPTENTEHAKALGSIATTLADVTPDVIPVVTTPVYKHKLSPEGLRGTAGSFYQRLRRDSDPRLRNLMSIAKLQYADLMGLEDEMPSEEALDPPAVSDWVLTLATRRSFVDNLGALDTQGVQDRITRLRDRGGWMICILDASEGLLVTKKRTERLVNTMLEGPYEDYLDTRINPTDEDNPDIPVFSEPHSLKDFLISRGLVDPMGAKALTLTNSEESHQSVWDMAEILEIFTSADQPLNASLEDFERWIHAQGTVRSFYKDYLLWIRDQMQAAVGAPNLAAREEIVKLIRASLTDARLQGMDRYIVAECARVINTHVLMSKLSGPKH
jgi:hypothetical protein